MNKYGLLAQEHWATHAPTRYGALEDPATFFTELGETAATQIEALAMRLEANEPAKQEYLERVAQLTSLQRQAEEVVLAELVYSVPPEPASLVDELEDLLGQLPSPEMVQDLMQNIEWAAQDRAEMDGDETVAFTMEEEERLARLRRMLPLVTVPKYLDTMSEAWVRDRLLALRELAP